MGEMLAEKLREALSFHNLFTRHGDWAPWLQ
jgi:hypothetical protein